TGAHATERDAPETGSRSRSGVVLVSLVAGNFSCADRPGAGVATSARGRSHHPGSQSDRRLLPRRDLSAAWHSPERLGGSLSPRAQSTAHSVGVTMKQINEMENGLQQLRHRSTNYQPGQKQLDRIHERRARGERITIPESSPVAPPLFTRKAVIATAC